MNNLRDTGAAQSLLLRDVLPVSDETSCQAVVLIQGVEMGLTRIPLHYVQLKSELVSGTVTIYLLRGWT